MQKIRVKICCICSVEEAKLANAYGASALGFVGHMPSGPGVDLCSSVRTNGKLNENKLCNFFKIIESINYNQISI
tara:strand:+ start:561 stop:785 length:225 start_codon:yes stop_codon:yes gene_type:complete